MLAQPRWSFERYSCAAFALMTLAPVLLQGLWGPLANTLSARGDAYHISAAAVLVAMVTVLAHVVTHGPLRLLAVFSAVPLALSLVQGASAIGAACVSFAVVAACCAGLLPWLLRRLPAELDGLASRNKGVAVLMFVLGIAAVTGTTRLGAFMSDSSRPELSLVPELPFFVHHSCLTAYVEGERLATEGVENLYDIRRWPDLNGTPRSATGAYAPFALDAFAYPPPFLLLPRLVSWLGDFASERALWYTLNGLFTAAGLWIVASWVGGRAGLRALLFTPLIWLSGPTLGTLQVGNAHLAVMVAAMLALVAFDTRRYAVGGALLAFSILAKVSPGLLILVLLVRGRFREVAWTAAFCAVYALAGLAAFGPDAYIDFVSYELPRLSSGEALTFLAGPDSVPINLAPFGIPFKLAALGVQVGDPWILARRINTAFTAVLVVLAVLAARRRSSPRATAEVWAALLTLSSLRSPLAPGYVAFALLWLLSLRASEVHGVARVAGLAAVWGILTVVPPFVGDRLLVYSLVQQGVLLTVATLCLLRTSDGSKGVHWHGTDNAWG